MSIKKALRTFAVLILSLERKTGFEPATLGLGSQCSTTEPLPHQRLLLYLKNAMSQVNYIFTLSDIILKNFGNRLKA